MHLFLVGYPGDVGGANTECWHTVKLWREGGWKVALLPIGQPNEGWRQRLDRIGAVTHVGLTPETWPAGTCPNGLPGSVVVSFGNSQFPAYADRFRELGCRVVWAGCMNFVFPAERLHYRRHGVFDRYVFQSRYQRDQLEPQLRKFGYQPSQGALIRGALAWDEFPFRPLGHNRGEAFVVGRLSRAAADKYHRQTWRILDRVLHPRRARVMGWSREIEAALGPPPPWAEVLPPGTETAANFLATLHALAPAGQQAVENWPRVGLEAMAAGVPVVTENKGGWPEMIRHGATGYLADTPDEISYWLSRLAYDEPHRRELVHQARRAVEEELADPQVLWSAWKRLLEGLMAAG